ncbi:MBL fold metallo-hydrolase [Candidatus Bathyarchaeota archaeon]|nr:MBL fold metallo-hydrolase [Candidatus Bathyarchaeota archaeon]
MPMPIMERIHPSMPVYSVRQPNAPLFQAANGIYVADPAGDGGILIDCIFQPPYIKSFLEVVGKKVGTYIATHFHVDHSAKVHYYDSQGIDVVMPAKEVEYMRSADFLLEHAGLRAGGLDDLFHDKVMRLFGWKPVVNATGVSPGTAWNVGGIKVEMIGLPGHSPGHPGFTITNGDNEKIVCPVDLGFDHFGPWFGFPNASLPEYLESMARISREIDNAVAILPSHEPVIKDGYENLCNEMTRKLEGRIAAVQALMDAFPKGFTAKDGVEREVIYRKEKLLQPILPLFLFWETWMVEHICKLLVDRNLAEEIYHASDPPGFPGNVYRSTS